MIHIKKIIKYIVNALTVFLIFVLLLVIYGKLALAFSKNSYPNYFGYTLFEVSSGSMQPTLDINDVILVKITNKDLKKDDIITFVSDNAIITHRIVFIDEEKITVKGDNNNVADTQITTDNVIGKVIHIYPHLGIWKKVITEPKILIAIFVTLLLFDFALSYNLKDNKKKKKDEVKDQKEEIKIEKIEPVNVESSSNKILEITKTIDLEEINRFIAGTDIELNKKEIKEVKEELTKHDNYEDSPNLSDKQKEFLDYTIRLDLSEIQNRIDKKIR